MKNIFLEIHKEEIFLNFTKKYSALNQDYFLGGISYDKGFRKISLVLNALENDIDNKNYKVIK